MDCEPLSAFVPDQAPEATQAVAFFVDQVRVEAAPELTVLGLAVRVTTGASAATVTVTACFAEPADPAQAISYSVVLESAPVDQLPLVANAPLQPPDAVQVVALVELQVKVDALPVETVDGEAFKVTVGAVDTTTTFVEPEADPLDPVQVSV